MVGGGGVKVKTLVHRVSFSQTGPVCVPLVVVKNPPANEIERCNQKSFLGTYKVIVILRTYDGNTGNTHILYMHYI
jgi:hypothetical protein